jgi:pectate lyase
MRTRPPPGRPSGSTPAAAAASALATVAVPAVPQPAGTAENAPAGLGAGGYAGLRGSDPGGAATGISQTGTFAGPPYGHSAEPASPVAASVTQGAGAGKP